MRVAIPIFGEDVSPRLGCSTAMLLATVEADAIRNEEVRDIAGLSPWQLPDFLVSLGVAKVICGGVHRHLQGALESKGVEVIWGVIGPAADALLELRSGTLQRDQFLCRGQRGRRWNRKDAGAAPVPAGGPRAGGPRRLEGDREERRA